MRMLIAALAVALCCAVSPVDAQDRGDWFKSLKQPGTGVSCCDISDCKRTEARWENGGWTALYPDGEPVQIPHRLVLDKKSIDGDAYLCAGPMSKRLYCFVPPDFGS